jgi:hypothetical protein
MVSDRDDVSRFTPVGNAVGYPFPYEPFPREALTNRSRRIGGSDAEGNSDGRAAKSGAECFCRALVSNSSRL